MTFAPRRGPNCAHGTPSLTEPEHAGGKPPKVAGPRFFLVMMAVYLLAVHAAGFGAYRLPGQPFDGASWLVQTAPVMDLAPSLPWFVQQLALLYGCMVCVFFLTRYAVRGPWWYGSLTGTLFMAHPLKSGAVLAVGGPWLLLALLNLLTLTLFAAWRERPTRGRAVGVVVAFAIALAADPRSAALLPLMLFYALVFTSPPAPRRVLSAALVLSSAALYGWAVVRGGALPSLETVAQPLLLVLYPVGLLPENALRFEAYPVLLYVTFAATLGFVAWVAWLAKHPAIHWCLGAALLWRLLQGAPVDPVYLDGGERMGVEIALLLIGFAAVCHQCARHPKWGRHIVSLTTLLCLVCFVHQFRTVWAWRDAGAWRAAQVQAATPPAPLADWQYHGPAPLRLPEIDAPPLNTGAGVSAALSPSGLLTVRGWDAAGLLYPGFAPAGFDRLLRPQWVGAVWRGAAVRAMVVEATADGIVLRLDSSPPASSMEAP